MSEAEEAARETVSADELREILRRHAVRPTVADVAAMAGVSEEGVRTVLDELRGRAPAPEGTGRSSFDAAQARAEAWQARESAGEDTASGAERRSRFGCGPAVLGLLGLVAAAVLGWAH